MAKRSKDFNFSAEEDELLKARVDDAFDSAASYREKFIGFLDPHEAAVAQKRAGFLCSSGAYDGCSYEFFGGYEGAERVFLGVFPPYSQHNTNDFPVAAIEIKWRFAALSHRDFLGALLALGIVRSKIGDIIVGDGKCTVFAEKTVASFIVQNLLKVGSAGVQCKIADGEIVREDHFKEISATVASNRLDCVVCALTGCSRSAAAQLIAGGLVLVDFEPCLDNTSEVSEGSTVSIRGHGRFVIDGIGPKTRKGRLAFAARKYL